MTSADRPRTVTGRSSAERETETETERKPLALVNDALGANRETSEALTARIRAIHPVDAITASVCGIRPEWSPVLVRAAILRDRRALREVASAAVRAACDPSASTPYAIERTTSDAVGATPGPLQIDQWRDAPRCPNGAIHNPAPCALCRAGIIPEEPA